MTPAPRRIGRPPLTDEEVGERREHILAVTLRLVARDGSDRVRLRDVASEADASVGMLQHYFDTRDDLLREAFRSHARRVVGNVEGALSRADDAWGRITALVGDITRSPDYLQRCALWVEFAAASIRDAELRDLMLDTYSQWRAPLAKAIAEGVEQGVFSPVMPEAAVADSLLALFDGYEIALAIREQTDVERVADTMIEAARALLGYRP
jgi:AcrR family transcriptional regulator